MLNLVIVSHPDDEILGYGGTGHIQVKKGHICPGIKKNLILLNIVLKFFSNIF